MSGVKQSGETLARLQHDGTNLENKTTSKEAGSSQWFLQIF